MVLRDHKDPLNTSRGIMGPLENSAGVQNNRGRLKQRFDLIRKLGQGTYGKVQLGIDKETGQEVAIKTIKKSKIETEADLIRIRREIQIMSSVRHPNIIHIYEVFENREKMVLVMEYAAGGELYDYLNERKILQEDEARRIFRQIASAVYYCHKNKICHRDLKLENILLDEKSNAKIADFGLSNVFDDVNLLKTFCGSPLYASPEIVRGLPYKGPEVDCWSLGVLLYTLVYGAMPFDGSNFKRLVKQISAGDYYEPKKPAEASSLIRSMLTVEPKRRAKVQDICSNPWINQGFEAKCLDSAEELAKKTPVRIDVLLTLAPNSTVAAAAAAATVAASQGAAEETGNRNQNESDSALNEPPKKARLQDEAGAGASAPPSGKKDGSAAPAKPKRKTQVKSKSKTTPLVLDLIQDVVEEEAEDVEMGQEADVGVATAAAAPSKDEDEADTLSEISEIQTIAEEVEKPKLKKKEEVKGVKNKVDQEKNKTELSQTTAATATTTTTPKPPAATSAVLPPLQQKPTPAAPAPTKVVGDKSGKKPETELKDPEKVSGPPAPAAAAAAAAAAAPSAPSTELAPPPPQQTEAAPGAAPTPKPAATVLKKKILKPKSPSSSEAEGAPPTAPKTPNATAAEERKPKASEKLPSASASPSGSGSDEKGGGGSADDKPKKTLNRQRSGSVSDVSPTRVERRNSKIISQKTAELIQNLETKTSNGVKDDPTLAPKPPAVKKLVIPNFKVSDSKNKFETKPPRPITSSLMSQSKAAFEAKAQQSSSPPKAVAAAAAATTDKPKELAPAAATTAKKGKSPSPVPPPGKEEKKEDTGGSLTLPEKDAASSSSPKTKAKMSKSPEPKPITPEPPSVSEATITTTATNTSTTVVAALPEEKSKLASKSPGKIQIPAAVAPKEVRAPGPAHEATPSSKPTLQNKEQAAKKITSVINKIVTSGSQEKFGTPTTGPGTGNVVKTEVVFPVSAASSQDRVIPIKFEDEGAPESGRIRFPPTRLDSFKRFDSASSIYSRQNSTSDTESCSISVASSAHPRKKPELRKCPREFLIPIKLEGSGALVTPKDEVLSDAGTTGGSEDEFRDGRLRSGRFGAKHKRYSSLLSDSSVDDEGSASAGTSRKNSASLVGQPPPSHSRSRSQGDEPETPGSAGVATTFKRYRVKRPDLDRSDSFSSAEDDDDFFEVFTADSLFSNLLDRVRNLTKRINREGSVGPNWADPGGGFGLWAPSSSLRDLMARAPSESRSFTSSSPGGITVTTHRSYSREPPSHTGSGSGSGWRRSLSRDVSGESDVSGSFMRSESGRVVAKDPSGSSCSSANPQSSNSECNNDGSSCSSGEAEGEEFLIPIKLEE